MTSAPLLLATSWVSAVSFHRERTTVGIDAPVGDGLRVAGRLVASAPLVLLALAFAALPGSASVGSEVSRSAPSRPHH